MDSQLSLINPGLAHTHLEDIHVHIHALPTHYNRIVNISSTCVAIDYFIASNSVVLVLLL